MPYQNILVAVDLGATTETVIQRRHHWPVKITHSCMYST